MTYAFLEDLIHNAALLLLIVYLYDLASTRWRLDHYSLGEASAGAGIGLALGLIGIGVMTTPLDLGNGVIYDARSLLLGITGLFFGAIPTLVAMLMTGAYRLYLGGGGMWTGAAVVLATGCLGLLWRHYRRPDLSRMRIGELYLFGFAVQFTMLMLQLTLPNNLGLQVLPQIVVPVLLVFPPTMVLIGVLIINRMRRDEQTEALLISENHLEALYRHAPVALWREDLSRVKHELDRIRAAGHTDISAYFSEHPGEPWRLAQLVRVLDINDAGLRQIGATSVTEARISLDKVFNESSIAVFAQQVAQLAEGATLFNACTICTTLQGEEQHIELTCFVIPGHEETLDLVIVTTQDITEDVHRHQALKSSYSLLTNLTDQVPGLIYQFLLKPDGSMSFPYASRGIERIYGVSPAQAVEDAAVVFASIDPRDVARVHESIMTSAQTLERWHCDYRVNLPGLGERWLSGSSQPSRQPDGSTLWHGYIRDVTEHKQLEQRLQLTSKVFEAAGEGVLITDADQHIIAVNEAFTRVTGYSEAEVLGKRPSILSSGKHDPSFYRSMWKTLSETGTWAGDIWNRRKNGEIYPEWLTTSAVKDDSGKTEYYVAVFSDLSEIRRAQGLAERMAMEDVLTGLANRSAFILRMDRFLAELRGAKRFSAMLLLDLDRFRDINQNEGLERGDLVLKTVGQSLQQRFGKDYGIARVGADEFAIMITRLLGSREEAGRVALDVFEQARAQVLSALSGVLGDLHVELSAGIVMLPPEEHEHAAEILQGADWAASQAKLEGGGRALFFASTMGQEIRERHRLERELRVAAELNQLRLFIQPQVDAEGHQVSVEALIRWQHPERGLVPPGMFISLAEEAGFISVLELWMLRETCQLLAGLERSGQALRVSLNISATHFEREAFVPEVRRVIQQSGIDPSWLVFEITESVVVENMGAVIEKMLDLRTLGIHFSLDDFGTGYSSLSYLKRLPIDELKIDRSFITDAPTDPSDAALVETILGVARTLRLRVVAEGVETREQADFLNARGDVIHQGYLYDKPLPVHDWQAKYMGSKA